MDQKCITRNIKSEVERNGVCGKTKAKDRKNNPPLFHEIKQQDKYIFTC